MVYIHPFLRVIKDIDLIVWVINVENFLRNSDLL